jgi:hypothetical protein
VLTPTTPPPKTTARAVFFPHLIRLTRILVAYVRPPPNSANGLGANAPSRAYSNNYHKI